MKELKIAVIGQGVIGVSSALAILEALSDVKVGSDFKIRVTIFGDRPFEETCSYGPSGHFEVDRDEYKDFAKESFLHFVQIYRENNPDVTGVKLLSNFHISDHREKLESLIANAYDIILNCAGINAGKLAGDDEIIPVKGAALEVYAPWFKHTGETAFIGTTRTENCSSTEVTEDEKQDILRRYEEFHPAMKGAKIVSTWAGIRCERKSGILRLERQERFASNGKKYHVIHNYGHGGYGFILHWGCAQKVVDLIRETII